MKGPAEMLRDALVDGMMLEMGVVPIRAGDIDRDVNRALASLSPEEARRMRRRWRKLWRGISRPAVDAWDSAASLISGPLDRKRARRRKLMVLMELRRLAEASLSAKPPRGGV